MVRGMTTGPLLTRRHLLIAGSAVMGGLLAGCTSDAPGTGPATGGGASPGSSAPDRSTAATTRAASGDPTALHLDRTIARELNVPWGLAFLDDGSALVSERDTARIVRVGDGAVRTVGEVPGVVPAAGLGEGGLLGIVLTPDAGAVLAMITTTDDNRIVRMSFDGSGLGTPEVLVDGIARATHHNGGRLAIGPDGLLYASTGDAGRPGLAQDRTSLNGKILRMTLDGTAADGNPFDNRVWSYGHRNIEGLAFDAEGRLWASEFGNHTYDELNLIRPGANYGWPQTEGPTDAKGVTGPEAWWPTDQASPAGLGITRSTAYLAALRGECVWAVPLAGTQAGDPVRTLAGEGLGRIRNAFPTPDGSLWVTTSNTDGRAEPGPRDDRILRVTIGASKRSRQ
jgi:glucose/arabinose dehydrogenase